MALRFGILGAARIAPPALVKPAREVDDVDVVAVAARDAARAAEFASHHGIPRAHAGYDELLADPDVDAVYNPLPNGLHGHWTIRALRAGKDVLCEKPFTANAEEARAVAAVATETGRTVVEAFHWRYHPLAQRMLEIVGSGELGDVERIESSFCTPLLDRRDIRYRLDLAGGALMDLGCYPVHLVRTLAGAEPTVTTVDARTARPGIDRVLVADLVFADGRTGRVRCSMMSPRLAQIGATVTGTEGTLRVLNPFAPQYFHVLAVRTSRGRRVEHLGRTPTYTYQLRAFRDAVRDGAPVPTGPDDAIANMTVIDAAYEAAGLGRREPTPVEEP